MTQRIVIVGLLVAFVTALLPANVFAEESHPLASLQTSAGLTKALQAAQTPSPKVATGAAASSVRAQQQQQAAPKQGFFSSTGGKVAIAALAAVGVGVFIATWNDPKIARIGQ